MQKVGLNQAFSKIVKTQPTVSHRFRMQKEV